MIRRLYPVILIIPLLAACDRQREGAASGDPGKPAPQTKRAQRSSRDERREFREEQREALRESLELPESEDRTRAIAEVAWNSLETDPELSRQAFDHLPPDGKDRLRLVQHLAMRLAEDNPDKALQWAAELESEAETAAARGRIALVIADEDPRRAGELLSEFGMAGRDFDATAVEVVQRWSAKSPPEAAAWVAVFPPGAARDAGIRAVLSPWLKADPQSAFSWMAGLGDEALRGESALAVAEALLRLPKNERNGILSRADESTRAQIARVTAKARQNVGDDARP